MKRGMRLYPETAHVEVKQGTRGNTACNATNNAYYKLSMVYYSILNSALHSLPRNKQQTE